MSNFCLKTKILMSIYFIFYFEIIILFYLLNIKSVVFCGFLSYQRKSNDDNHFAYTLYLLSKGIQYDSKSLL